VISVLGSAGAAHAAPSFHCEASALRVTLGGQQTIEPVKTGADGGCADAQGTPAAQVPSLLTAKALTADTHFDAAATVGSADGGIASVSVVPTPEQISQLPTEQVISNLPNQTMTAPEPLASALTAAGLPTSIQFDIRDAVRALVPTPGTALLGAEILTSHASIGCTGGKPALDGTSRIAGVKLAGQDLALTGVVDQAVSLIDSQSIDPHKLDVGKVSIITPLDGITQPLLAQVQAGIGQALAALPPIALPASVVQVKLTPNEQIRSANSLIQRALHAQVTLAGQPLIDAVFGEALVSGADGACATVAQGGVADQLLGCTDRSACARRAASSRTPRSVATAPSRPTRPRHRGRCSPPTARPTASAIGPRSAASCRCRSSSSGGWWCPA
jgi:hypothetical protein